MEYKAGQYVKIVNDNYGHKFLIGSICVIVKTNNHGGTQKLTLEDPIGGGVGGGVGVYPSEVIPAFKFVHDKLQYLKENMHLIDERMQDEVKNAMTRIGAYKQQLKEFKRKHKSFVKLLANMEEKQKRFVERYDEAADLG